MNLSWLVWMMLIGILLVACIVDQSQRRVPNALVVTGTVVGLCLQVALPPGQGLFDASRFGGLGFVNPGLAVLTMTVLGIVLWRLRLFGAGDAKLLASLAAFFGMSGVVPLLLFTVLLGGLLAVAWPALRVWAAAAGHGFDVNDTRLPYSIAIAGGAVAYALTLWFGVITVPYI